MFSRAWLAGGIPRTACIAAYEPICAVSLADSYINRANPGTYDAAPQVAPTWAESTGWTFTGTQWLKTPARIDCFGTVIARTSMTSQGDRVVVGYVTTASEYRFFMIEPMFSSSTLYWAGGASGAERLTVAGPVTGSCVTAIAKDTAYRNGAVVGAIPYWADRGVMSRDGAIGALWPGYGPYSLFQGDVQAIYIYNAPLTPTQVRAVTDAMNMLPMRPRVPAFPSWLRGAALTQFRKLLGLRTGSRGVSE